MHSLWMSSVIVVALGVLLIIIGLLKSWFLIIVGSLLVIMGAIRLYFIKDREDQLDFTKFQDDMVAKKLADYPIMYNAYHLEAKLLYGENDGILLEDEKHDVYLAVIDTKQAALDIQDRMKDNCSELYLFSKEYVSVFQKEYPYISERTLWFNKDDNYYEIKLNNDYELKESSLYYDSNKVASYHLDELLGISIDGASSNQQLLVSAANNELIKKGLKSYTLINEDDLKWNKQSFMILKYKKDSN